MNVEEADNELNRSISTYGLITAERILLGIYKLKLSHLELVEAVKSPVSLYRRILQIPLKNVLNGIILQQASDYQIYIQKLLIDYLLAGEGSKEEEGQGAELREEIEDVRQWLIIFGDEFHQTQGTHDLLIAKSQAALIKLTKRFNDELEKILVALELLFKETALFESKSRVRKALNHALIYGNRVNQSAYQDEFIEKMNEILKVSYSEEKKEQMIAILAPLIEIESHFDQEVGSFVTLGLEVSQSANSFRNQFYETILRVRRLLKSLPGYSLDPIQDAINREPLYFDRSLGALEE